MQADLPTPAVDFPDHPGDSAFLSVEDNPIIHIVQAIGRVMFANGLPPRPEKECRVRSDLLFHLKPVLVAVLESGAILSVKSLVFENPDIITRF